MSFLNPSQLRGFQRRTEITTTKKNERKKRAKAITSFFPVLLKKQARQFRNRRDHFIRK